MEFSPIFSNFRRPSVSDNELDRSDEDEGGFVNHAFVSDRKAHQESSIPIYPSTLVEYETSLPITIDLTGPCPIVFGPYPSKSQETVSQKRFDRLIKESPHIPVPFNTYLETSLTTFDINHDLIKEGRRFIRKHFFSVIFAHWIGVAFILAVKPIQALLLRTASIHRKEKSLGRYLALLSTLRNIYECDLFVEDSEDKFTKSLNPSSKTLQELQRIKDALQSASKHYPVFLPPEPSIMKPGVEEQRLLKALKCDLLQFPLASARNLQEDNKILTTVNPEVPVSQYTLALAQFVLFGLLSLFPRTFGIHQKGEAFSKGLAGFTHIWALYGHLLGLEERFNLCTPANLDPVLNMSMFRKIFVYSLQTMDDNLIKLWKAFTSKSSLYFFLFRTKSLLLFLVKNVIASKSSSEVDINNDHASVEFSLRSSRLYETMSFLEKWCYHFYLFLLQGILRLWIGRAMINLLSKTFIYLGNKFYIERRLKTKEKYELNRDIFVKTVD